MVLCKVIVRCFKQILMCLKFDYVILLPTYGYECLGRYLLTGIFECRNARSTERAFAVSRLEAILTKAVRLPWLYMLRPFLLKVLAVLRPMKQLHISLSPRISALKPCKSITVISANLWHDWPFHRRLSHRLETFAQLAEEEDADVVLLQEVMRTPQIQMDEWLGKRLGMGFVYSRVNGDEEAIGFEEGLAVLSRFPIMAPQRKNLGLGGSLVRRMALAAEIHSPFGCLWVISVHLGLLKKRNQMQWQHLRNWISGLGCDHTALIGGDFNIHEHSNSIRQAQGLWIDTYRSVNPEGDGTTHEMRWPWGSTFLRRRLDYIFLRPGIHRWRIMDARHLLPTGQPHSDHYAVITRCSPM